MKLRVVSNFLAETRRLLQDEISPFRYPDDALLTSINAAMLEISKRRPDIMVDFKYRCPIKRAQRPTELYPVWFDENSLETLVPIPAQYKMAVIYYMTGYSQLSDVEDTQDTRAAAFMNLFSKELLQLA